MIPINYWAVLVAAVVQMILGYFWYGPLFGKPWAAMMGFSPEAMKKGSSKGMGISYAMMAIGALLMSWILAHAIVFVSAYLVIYGVSAGIAIGFVTWLGFVAPVTMGSVLWEGKPWRLWVLNVGYYLMGFCLMGAIIAAWS